MSLPPSTERCYVDFILTSTKQLPTANCRHCRLCCSLDAVRRCYRAVSEYDLVRSVEHEMSGDLKDAFKAVIMCIQNKPGYFAERLYKSMKVD